MTQILVTLNEDVATQTVRKAIELLRGVTSTMVFQNKSKADSKTIRQQKYVKETLERAFDEVKRAERGEHQLKSDEEFMEELKAEGLAWILFSSFLTSIDLSLVFFIYYNLSVVHKIKEIIYAFRASRNTLVV